MQPRINVPGKHNAVRGNNQVPVGGKQLKTNIFQKVDYFKCSLRFESFLQALLGKGFVSLSKCKPFASTELTVFI